MVVPTGRTTRPPRATAPSMPSASRRRTRLPKAEPYCYQAPPVGPTRSNRPRCAAPTGRRTPRPPGGRAANTAANDAGRTNLNTAATVQGSIWRSDGPQLAGRRAILSITDSASAAQFGLQAARLSRSGDNDDDRRFIALDDAGVLAGLEAMADSEDVEGFLVPDPEVDAPDAYPSPS